MGKFKITLHRALAELKLLDNKIVKAIGLIQPTGLMQKNGLVNNLSTKEVFNKDVLGKYQSVQDLIERKTTIKSAIVAANAVTIVEIAGERMTIAEAINFKTVIDLKKQLIKTIQDRHNSVLSVFNTKNEEIKKVALDNAKIMIGRQGDDRVKATDTDVKAIVDPYVKRMEFHLVDPLKAEQLIIHLQEEVDTFEMEVDAALSEINALTTIEI